MKPYSFTKREKHVVIIVVLFFACVLAFGIDQSTLDDYEFIGLFFFVLPLGIYITTDPERINK